MLRLLASLHEVSAMATRWDIYSSMDEILASYYFSLRKISFMTRNPRKVTLFYVAFFDHSKAERQARKEWTRVETTMKNFRYSIQISASNYIAGMLFNIKMAEVGVMWVMVLMSTF